MTGSLMKKGDGEKNTQLADHLKLTTVRLISENVNIDANREKEMQRKIMQQMGTEEGSLEDLDVFPARSVSVAACYSATAFGPGKQPKSQAKKRKKKKQAEQTKE
jgi:hypothetical protein